MLNPEVAVIKALIEEVLLMAYFVNRNSKYKLNETINNSTEENAGKK